MSNISLVNVIRPVVVVPSPAEEKPLIVQIDHSGVVHGHGQSVGHQVPSAGGGLKSLDCVGLGFF